MKTLYTRGQMEAFGLAVIVVLLIIGLFFYVSFKANAQKNAPQYHKEYITDQTPQKFVIAYSKLTVQECVTFKNRQAIEDLIRDCGTKKEITCAGLSSCQLINKTAYTLLNETYIKRNSAFYFMTEGLGDQDIKIINGPCDPALKPNQGRPGVTYVTKYPYPGQVTITMSFCT